MLEEAWFRPLLIHVACVSVCGLKYFWSFAFPDHLFAIKEYCGIDIVLEF